MKGDGSVVDDFKNASKFWAKFFGDNSRITSVADQGSLTVAIGQAQSSFEVMLNLDRHDAKQLMPWTCFASLYDETNGYRSAVDM